MNQKSAGTGSKPTLVWLAGGQEGYGVASAIIGFSRELKRRNWSVVGLVSTDGALYEVMQQAGLEMHIVGNKAAPAQVSGTLTERIKAYWQLRSLQASLVRDARLVLEPYNVQAVQTCNQLLLEATGSIARHFSAIAIWRMANNVTQRRGVNYMPCFLQLQCRLYGIRPMANSRFTADSLGRGPVSKTHNHHGCDPLKFRPAPAEGKALRAELGIDRAAAVFAIAARLDETGDKGQYLLVEALSLMKHVLEQQDVHLVLAGGDLNGGLANRIRAFAQQESLAHRVHCLGRRDDVERVYAAADVVINCRLSPEPFGLSVIEAMMAGRPVLAHSSGGPAETVIHGTTGWLFDSVTQVSVKAALEQAIADRARWADMGENAREHARRHFTLDAEVDRWLAQCASSQSSRVVGREPH